MCCAAKVRESFFERERVGCLHEHKCHRGAEKNDMGRRKFAKFFALKVSVIMSLASLIINMTGLITIAIRVGKNTLFPKSNCLRKTIG